MDRVLERTPEGTSPRTFALNYLRPKSSFVGCSRIGEYELQGKLGEGTFGYVALSWAGLPAPRCIKIAAPTDLSEM